MKKIGLFAILILWLGLCVTAWVRPSGEISESERRKLQQFPAVSVKELLSGDWMEDFESYTLDQFPLRDTFRRVKALIHYNLLGQKDNNGIYIADGYAAKLEYPLNENSLNNALEKFRKIYDKYLTGSKVIFSVVPDKGYFLAEANGYPAMDYEALMDTMAAGLPWAEFVDISGELTLESYYKTDTHWRQEKILGVAQKLCEALGADAFEQEELVSEVLERPFYGVYYGQVALPMDAEQMYVVRQGILENFTVYNHENGKTTGIYDWSKLESQDLYDVFLSGAAALLTLENPTGNSDKELIIFRDSYGSSLIPLLLKDYAKVTVIDTRYIAPDLLDRFVDFHGQDVLMLYSTLLLNNSFSLK